MVIRAAAAHGSATAARSSAAPAHGSALGNDAGDAFYFFELEADVDGVTFDSCASAFDTWLRVLRLSPEVIYMRFQVPCLCATWLL